LEGSDSDTRRRAASDLVRGLLEHFAKDITEICSQYSNEYLETYNRNKADNWKAKDTALYLISSLSAKALTVQFGATQVNEYMDVLPIFGNHVLPDLQLPIDGAIHPILKVDAIKYVLLFRSQLTKEQLLEIIPFLISHLGSSNYVVHTYAAVCLERIFAIKSGSQFMFDSSNIASVAPQLLNRLFELIEANSSPNKLGENDYLMKGMLSDADCYSDHASCTSTSSGLCTSRRGKLGETYKNNCRD
jgi:exportin-2 (importin alpha re-exporter)